MLLAARLVAVRTGKPRSDELTIAVLMINSPSSFCIAHVFLSSVGTEALVEPIVAVLLFNSPFSFCIARLFLSFVGIEFPIDTVEDSSRIHKDVMGIVVVVLRDICVGFDSIKMQNGAEDKLMSQGRKERQCRSVSDLRWMIVATP